MPLDGHTGIAVYGAGGGIAWGSDAALEHAGLLAKTAVLGDARPAAHRRPLPPGVPGGHP